MATMSENDELEFQNAKFKVKTSYFIIADESGLIVHASKNFLKDFIDDLNFLNFKDSRLLLDDIILNLRSYS